MKYDVEFEAEIAELDEKIARAATSWSHAFPGRKEVPRTVARDARKAMRYARKMDVRPSEIKFSGAGIEDGVAFFVAVDEMKIGGQ